MPPSPGQADNQLKITTGLADEVGHKLSCFVCYVELKIAPTS